MISVPSLIRDYLREDSHKKNIRIHFPNYERTDICNDQIVINTVQFTESLCSQNKLKFGLCEAPMFECEVVGVGNITGAIIEVSCEIYCPASVTGAVFRTDLQAYVYPIPYGTFKVSEAKRQSDMNHRKITAYGGQAAINWEPTKMEKMKVLPLAGTTAPTYNPNLGYLISENGVEIIGDEVDITEVLTNYGVGGTSYDNSDYLISTIIPNRIAWFGVPSAWPDRNVISDYDALYKSDRELLEGITEDYIFSKIQTALYPYLGDATFSDLNIKRMKRDAKYCIGGNGSFHISTTASEVGAYSYDLFGDSFYPYVDGFYSGERYFALNFPYNLKILVRQRGTLETLYEEEIPLCPQTPKVYKWKYKADASAWTSFRIGIPCDLNFVGGNVNLWSPRYSEIDMAELCSSIAETMGTFVSITREGFDAKFIDIKQLFSLLPSGTLYPGQHLHPGATTGGKLLPQYYQSCWYQDEYALPFGKVECKYKDTNNKECTYALFLNGYNQNSDDTTYRTYTIDNNVVINSNTWIEAQIQAICETIADNIAGVTYMPVEFTGMGYPYVESGDTFEILTPNNDSIVTIVLNRTLSGEQVLTDTYKSV